MSKNLKDRLSEDLKSSLRSKNSQKVLILRGLLASIHNEEINFGKDKDLPEENIIKVIQREAKKRKDAIDLYTQGDRQDKAEEEKKELEIIETYLPKPLDEKEVLEIIKTAIEKTNSQSPSDMGKVMGLVMAETKGRADGKIVKDLVLKELTN